MNIKYLLFSSSLSLGFLTHGSAEPTTLQLPISYEKFQSYQTTCPISQKNSASYYESWRKVQTERVKYEIITHGFQLNNLLDLLAKSRAELELRKEKGIQEEGFGKVRKYINVYRTGDALTPIAEYPAAKAFIYALSCLSNEVKTTFFDIFVKKEVIQDTLRSLEELGKSAQYQFLFSALPIGFVSSTPQTKTVTTSSGISLVFKRGNERLGLVHSCNEAERQAYIQFLENNIETERLLALHVHAGTLAPEPLPEGFAIINNPLALTIHFPDGKPSLLGIEVYSYIATKRQMCYVFSHTPPSEFEGKRKKIEEIFSLLEAAAKNPSKVPQLSELTARLFYRLFSSVFFQRGSAGISEVLAEGILDALKINVLYPTYEKGMEELIKTIVPTASRDLIQDIKTDVFAVYYKQMAPGHSLPQKIKLIDHFVQCLSEEFFVKWFKQTCSISNS